MKLKGPLHSIDARGEFAKVLTFSKNQSNNFAYFNPTVRRRTVSPFQTPQYRCAYNAIAYIWENIATEAQKDNWIEAPGNATPFMKFFIFNRASIIANGEVWDSPEPGATIIEDIRINPDIFWIELRGYKHIFPVAQTWDEPLNMKGHYRLYKVYFDRIPSIFPPGNPVPPDLLDNPTLLQEIECPCTDFIVKDGYSGFYNTFPDNMIWHSNQYGLYQFEAWTSTGHSCDINYYYYYDPVGNNIYWGQYA